VAITSNETLVMISVHPISIDILLVAGTFLACEFVCILACTISDCSFHALKQVHKAALINFSRAMSVMIVTAHSCSVCMLIEATPVIIEAVTKKTELNTAAAAAATVQNMS
jgi:hypothetical protein